MRCYKEEVEEIRVQLGCLVRDIIECCEEETILEYMGELVGIIRVMLMDSFKEVQMSACQIMTEFVHEYRKYLVNFAT
jgi:hypothetical protein